MWIEAEKIMTGIKDETKFNLGLASTFNCLLRRLNEDPIVKFAVETVLQAPEVGCLLFVRADEIFRKRAPEGYAHPGDLELTAYLYILTSADSDKYMYFVEDVAKNAGREFFFSSNLAVHLRDNYVNQGPVYSNQ